MKPNRRRLALFLVIDALVVAGLLVWWCNRAAKPSPVAQPPVPVPTALASPTPSPAELAALPTAPTGQVECHGMWNGQPFWLRLSPPDPELNGNRRLKILYSPPAPAEVEGAVVHDSPVMVIDSHLCIVQWDNRDGATGVLVTDSGYKVAREIHSTENDKIALKNRIIKQSAAWDLRLAPLFAVLAWRADAAWSVPAVDFWGSRASERLHADCHAAILMIAGVTFTVQPDAEGRVASFTDAQSTSVLTVTAWK